VREDPCSGGGKPMLDDTPAAGLPAAGEPIAIIGMSCRLPRADDPDSFWRLLRDGVDAVTEVPEGRWQPASLTEYRWGGFLSDVEGFDAAFFGISPNEAAMLDPQQRLTLELAWEALENARIIPAELRATAAGVFVGATSNDYAALRDRLGVDGVNPHSYTGTDRAIIANRVSYLLGLQGPSLTVDTGQSSSLVAVQLACESLHRGESGLALAGGLNLNLLAETTMAIGSLGALSPDGRCRVFDSSANGYVRGEGGALVVLKLLSAARRDGDPVHSVILGGAVNNDGGGGGLTSPSSRAQEQVIRLACTRAGVRAADVQYVELHGTGSRVGDPVEAAALGVALGEGRPATQPLLVGSVKTNIGHLEGAAGIAGLLKLALSIEHRELPASLHFRTPNPRIPLDELRLRVVGTACRWPAQDRPLVAGVSSFGIGGTNCHLVLGEAPVSTPSEIAGATPAGQDPAWVLSARSAESLRSQARRLRPRVDEAQCVDPEIVALSLVRTRATFEHRAVILGEDRCASLDALAAGRQDGSIVTGTTVGGKRVFTFPGNGSQWPEMARGLLDASSEFADRIAACAAALEPFVSYSLHDVLRGAPGAPALDRVDVVQPALWAVMVSLAELWRANGVEPDMVIGHSHGEIAAATVAGALSLPDGARVVALRSRAIAGSGTAGNGRSGIVGNGGSGIVGNGGMLAVAAPLHVVESAIGSRAPRVTVAGVNGPRSVVVSGSIEELADLQQHFTAAGYRAKAVAIDYASHSSDVAQIRDEILAALAPIRPVSTDIEFISAVTGEPMDTAGLDADYWYRGERNPMRFGLAVQAALHHGGGLFVECSPHPLLVAAVEEAIEEGEHAAAVVSTLRKSHGGMDQFRRALAGAYVCGASVDWTGPSDIPRSALMDLPTYAFQRRRYRLASPGDAASQNGRAGQSGPTAATEPAPAEIVRRSRRELRDLVLAATADVLGHKRAWGALPSRTFKDLGVDSAAAIELRNRLRSATGHALPTTLIFDYPTSEQLTDYLYTLSHAGQPAAVTARPAREDVDANSIAIVGIGCRYPGGVTSPEDLWELVIGRGDAITQFPVNRGWDLDALFAEGPERPGTSDTRLGGFLHDADQFDAGFFGISPREAVGMDPQQRLLLEICWEAVERGGIDADSLRGSRTGVFVGAMPSHYGPRLHQPAGNADGHRLTGTALSVVSGRVAYTFGLEGPAITVATACSSSLVAMHLAVQALQHGECSLALAGGVTVMAAPGMFVEFSRQHGLAVDGRCKAFSAAADGTGWAEGAGVLLLERLSDARRNGRRILAVVRGSAVNQDGHSNGLTAPNGLSQQRVIQDALADARLAACDVDAVEAHGTGTMLGDPIEARALIAAYGQNRPEDRPLWLGSVKSNIGHTQAAAGVAGVIKMVMAMRQGMLPPTLYADEPTPHVDWSAGNVRLLTKPVPWPVRNHPAFAGISAFGISGTNAHVIIEQPPQPIGAEPADRVAGQLVWVISARTDVSLRTHATRLLDFAATAPQADLAAAGFALLRRARFEHRAVVMAGDRKELLAALAAIANGSAHPCVTQGIAAVDVRPVLVFPGQGSQWAGMAVDLLDGHAGFREELLRCDEAFMPYTGWSVMDVLRSLGDAPPLEGSDVIQPVLFAVMVSLAAVWRSAGIDPSAVIGHSQGEIAAAYVAGALALEDAARIVALRSKALMKLTGTGGMLSVSLSADRVQEMLARWPNRLWVAILSGPDATVVAGDIDALDEFVAEYGERVRISRVAIDYAAHSPHVEALRDELLAILDGVEPRPTDVAICSSLTGEFVEPRELTADYWYRGLRHPVQFARAITSLTGSGSPLFIEVSPHPMLTGYVQAALRAADASGGAVGTLRRGKGGPQQFLKAVSQAFVLGADVDWRAVLGSAPRRHVDLPTYPFECRRFWLDDGAGSAGVAASGMTASPHPLLRASVPLADGDGYLLTGRLARGTTPWLADHAVDGAVLLPGTAFVELALEAATIAGCDLIEELIIEAPVALPESGGIQVQLLVSAVDDEGRRSLTVHMRPADHLEASWIRHASGTLATAGSQPGDALTVWPPADGQAVDLTGAYERLAKHGYEYGPAFQCLTKAWRADKDAYVEVTLPEHMRADAGRFTLHPALLDAALHYLVLAGLPAGDRGDKLLLPFSWSAVHVAVHGADTLRVRITGLDDGRMSLACYDSAGLRIAGVDALTLRQVPRRQGAPRTRSDAAFCAVEWTDLPVSDGDLTGRRWAVIGSDGPAEDLAGDLSGSGVDVSRYYDLPSLAQMTGDEVPSTVVVPCIPGAGAADVPASIRVGTRGVLEQVQTWLGDERFAERRLVFVTRNVFGGPDATVQGLAGGATWGLVRSAQTEHHGRFALVDVTGNAPASALASAVAAGEPQLVVRDGTVRVPRLVRRKAGATPSGAAIPGTVLVTGGTGALGALIAQRLAGRHGVRHLLLASRRGPAAPGAAELVTRLETLGAEATVAACDVSDRDALAAMLAQIPANCPLTGVVHAAGVLDDATVEGLSARHLETVFRPKADAAWHLHELTRQLPLSMFVLFSSVAGLIGNPGQGNYAAANVFLDVLAGYRQQTGLPAVSIAWGPWDLETGMMGGLTDGDVARMARAGVAPLSAEHGLDLFDAALAASDPLVVAACWDDSSLRSAAESGLLSPMLRGLIPVARPAAAAGSAGDGSAARGSAYRPAGDLPTRLAAMTGADARRLLVDLVRSHVAAVLAYPSPDAVQVDRAFSELGFDSLTAVELRNRLEAATGLRLSATMAFDHPTVTAAAEHLHHVLAPAPPPPQDTLRAALDQVQQAWPEPDDATRSKITAILHSALARWQAGPGGLPGAADTISSASDDEIFALIDNKT
jgi:acyl transferase domain-containing protein